MPEQLSTGLAVLVAVGAAAQWIAWRAKLPAILLLLLAGVLAGPVAGVLDPNALLGDLLLPIVSIAVALILFEGGLSLDLHEIKDLRGALTSLVTVGVLVSWIGAAVAAHYALSLSWSLALLLGAILTVTGPTVIGPLLRHIRPTGPAASLLKWEGIVIDPVGAMLALLVFKVLIATTREEAITGILTTVVLTILIGGLGGLIVARLIHVALRHHLIPDFLQNPFILGTVVAAFVGSNLIQKESGLLTVTVMGAVLANQHTVSLRHIVEFKENLRVLLISSVFILLAARIDLGALAEIGWNAAIFIGLLALLVRPLSVFSATLPFKALGHRDRLLISWLAPRGVVAAAVTSIFALELEHEGFAGGDTLIPICFSVIVGTVALYGLTAGPIARTLGLADRSAEGVLFIGAPEWAVSLAEILERQGLRCLLLDSNHSAVRKARLAGREAMHADALSESTLESIDYAGLGKAFAVTPSHDVNRLAALHFREVFGREQVYRLSPLGRKDQDKPVPVQDEQGRLLFARDMGPSYLGARFASGSRFKATKLSDEFDPDDWREQVGPTTRLLMLVRDRRLKVASADKGVEPKAGDTVIALVESEEE